MEDHLCETVQITNSCSVTIGAAFFWNSFRGWDKSLLMSVDTGKMLKLMKHKDLLVIIYGLLSTGDGYIQIIHTPVRPLVNLMSVNDQVA